MFLSLYVMFVMSDLVFVVTYEFLYIMWNVRYKMFVYFGTIFLVNYFY